MTDPLPPDLSVESDPIRNALIAVEPILQALIDKQYNIETWGLVGRLAAVKAALAHSAASGSEWRPIESAPKDGTWLVAAFPKSDMFSLIYHDGDHWVDDDAEPIYGMTHWQPLPPPPTKKEPETNG